MKRIFKMILPVAVAALLFAACSNEDNGAVTIRVGIGLEGETLDFSGKQKYFSLGDNVVYQFEVTAPAGLNKVEFSEFVGIGINQNTPVILDKYEDMTEAKWIYTKVIENIGEDVRYSVYAQDNNLEYNSAKVNILLDVTRYLSPVVLYDGLDAATSKTFCNLETGRTFYVGNTTVDPANMDFGFAYLEKDAQMRACFISMDQYWAAGVYPMVANKLNKAMTFKKVQGFSGNIEDVVVTTSGIRKLYEQADIYPAVGKFPEGKIANNLETGDVVAFRTHYGCCGLIQVTDITRKNESTDNSQDISFRILVENRYAKNI